MTKLWIRHLFPRSGFWAFVIDRMLSRLVRGMQDFYDEAQAFIGSVLLENWAETLSDPHAELRALGLADGWIEHLTDERKRTILIALRRKSTGTSRDRLQTLLRECGFNVYVHEWFEPGTGPDWVERDPTEYVVHGRYGRTRCGMPAARCGVESARCDRFLVSYPNYIINDLLLAAMTTQPGILPEHARGVFYVGGQTFPNMANVPLLDRQLLYWLLLRYKRAPRWALLLINFSYTSSMLAEETDEARALEIEVPWAWIWDPSVTETLTLSGSSPVRCDRMNNVISGASGWDAIKDGENTSPEYIADWRNGQAALRPSPGYLNATGATGPSAPYTLVYVAEFVPASGNTFRILATGIGAIDGPQPTPFYVQSTTMRTFAGNSVALGSATAYWGVPFIAFARVNGASYRVTLYPHGMPAVTFSGAGNPGTNRFQGSRFGKGETDGFWNAPIAWIGGTPGELTADVESQIYAQLSARFNIVVSP